MQRRQEGRGRRPAGRVALEIGAAVQPDRSPELPGGAIEIAGVAETIVLATDLVSLDDVTSGEMVLHLIGPDPAGTAVPGERAAFEVDATINGRVDTFAEVRIGTGDVDDAVLSVTHQPLADLLDENR